VNQGLQLAVELDKSTLHASLADPILGAISFLNEVMDRFPNAISFAPGAPNPSFFDEIDVGKALDVFSRYLAREKGLEPAQIRRILYQYGPSRGHINDIIARAINKDQHIDISPGAVVVTVGCQEAMVLVLRAVCASPADILGVVNPCFVGISGAARVLDVNTVGIDDSENGIDLKQLEATCRTLREKGKRLRLLYVAPDYSNPAGTLMSLNARRRLLDMAAREDFLLLEDNAYGFTAAPDKAIPTLKALDQAYRVIYLGTFAKICFPGARVGFAVADQPVRDSLGRISLLADELAALKSMITVNTSPISQAIIAGVLIEHDYSFASVCVAKSVLYRRNMRLLLDALEQNLGARSGFPYQIKWNAPRGGFFVRMRLPCVVDEDLLQLSAERYGVLWTPMAQFYLDGGTSNELRLASSFLTPEKISEGVQRLSLFLRDPKVMNGAEIGDTRSQTDNSSLGR
jgi:(S)-3,5-dihydroxyphenylglycine transaminase